MTNLGQLCEPVDKLYTHAKCTTQAFQSEAAIGFEKLAVSEDAHLADIKSGMRGEDS